MGRSISTGTLVRAQADFFSSGIRIPGVTSLSLTLFIFVNNVPISWQIQDGTSVPDASISAGIVYFNEITGNPGFYSVRLFPDRIGYWRIALVSVSLSQESNFEFDIIPATAASTGLTASFTK
jgi:hypothetical protein